MEKKLKKLLEKEKELIGGKEHTIRRTVIEEALTHDNPEMFFKDLSSHGCVSGMVNFLICYKDTHKFFNDHYDEIEELRQEYEQNNGTKLEIPSDSDLSNWLAWWAFEEVSYQIAQELELEL